MDADAEKDERETRPSSKKTVIIVAVAAAVLVLVAVAVLRIGRKAEAPSTRQTPESAEPVKAEPATNEEPSAVAAKPAAEPAKPAVAEKVPPSEKAGHPEKGSGPRPGHGAKPERTGRVAAEGRAPSEKGKPSAGGSTPVTSEPKSGPGSLKESDFQRANDAYQRGNAKLFKGDTAGAIADFNLALGLNPKDPAIHRGLGLAYAQAGKSAEAVKHLKAYLKEAPKANDRATIQKRIDQLHGK
jgi:tetratricopeptide (TPR) repeat protein